MSAVSLAKKVISWTALPAVLIDAGRFFIHPLEQIAVWRDYWRMRRNTLFIRKHHRPTAYRGTVVFVLASGMIYEAKMFAVLALGLMLAGWRAVVLSSRSYTWSHRYLGLFGITDFRYFEDVAVTEQEKAASLAAAESLASKPMTFQGVKEWSYSDAWIGPQILSTVSRSVMQGAPNVQDPEIQKRITGLLPETLETMHRANRMLDEIKPQMLVIVEANYAILGALVDTAIGKKITVIQAIQPVRDDALIFKKLTKETRRTHPASVAPDTMERFRDMPWTEKHEYELRTEFQNRYGGKWFLQSRNQPGVRQKGKEEIVKELGLDPHKKIAVVFSPILWDANLFYGEDLFEDYGDWFVQTVRAASRNPNVNWIIKLHPANAWKRAREHVSSEFSEVLLIRQKIGELPDHVKLLFPTTDISTWSLFECADYGITVRGTVGMELPCLGIPVFTAGTGRYSGLGFTIDSSGRTEYLEKLSRIQEFGRMTEEEILAAKKHAYIAFRLRPWVMKSVKAKFQYKEKGVHPLDHNLYLNVRSIEEISNNGDLEKWASFAASKTAVDYIDFSL